MADGDEQGGAERLRAAVAAVAQTATAAATAFSEHANALWDADHEVRERMAQRKAELAEVDAALAERRAALERVAGEVQVWEGKRDVVVGVLRQVIASYRAVDTATADKVAALVGLDA